jgi:hypothetical protein
LERLASGRHFNLLGPFVSFEETDAVIATLYFLHNSQIDPISDLIFQIVNYEENEVL